MILEHTITWHLACSTDDIPANGGACALIEGEQIAIFNFERRGEWYATQNLCPHRQQMALSRGMKPITIILADAHDIFRKSLKMILEDYVEIKIIGETSNLSEVLSLLKTSTPTLIILDPSDSQYAGIQEIKDIYAKYPSIKILCFSMNRDSEYIVKSVENGANGYLLKDTNKEELLRAIKAVSEGRKYFPPEISEVIIDGLLAKTSGIQSENCPIFEKITPKEKQILGMIVQGYNSREMADKLFLSIRTVDNHRANMMKKVKAKTRLIW